MLPTPQLDLDPRSADPQELMYSPLVSASGNETTQDPVVSPLPLLRDLDPPQSVDLRESMSSPSSPQVVSVSGNETTPGMSLLPMCDLDPQSSDLQESMSTPQVVSGNETTPVVSSLGLSDLDSQSANPVVSPLPLLCDLDPPQSADLRESMSSPSSPQVVSVSDLDPQSADLQESMSGNEITPAVSPLPLCDLDPWSADLQESMSTPPPPPLPPLPPPSPRLFSVSGNEAAHLVAPLLHDLDQLAGPCQSVTTPPPPPPRKRGRTYSAHKTPTSKRRCDTTPRSVLKVSTHILKISI